MLSTATLCIVSDGLVTVAEAELLRAVAVSLDCPLPPVIPEKHSAELKPTATSRCRDAAPLNWPEIEVDARSHVILIGEIKQSKAENNQSQRQTLKFRSKAVKQSKAEASKESKASKADTQVSVGSRGRGERY